MLRLALLVACGARAGAHPNSPNAPAAYTAPLMQQPPPLPTPLAAPTAPTPSADDDDDSECDDDGDNSIQLGLGLGFGLGLGLGLGLGIPGCIVARAITRTRAGAWQQTETRYNEMT
jgi:hypothetical protein